MLKAVLKGFGVSVLGVAVVYLMCYLSVIFFRDEMFIAFAAILVNFWGAAIAAFNFKSAPYKAGLMVVLINCIICCGVFFSIALADHTGEMWAWVAALESLIFYVLFSTIVGLIGIAVGKRLMLVKKLKYSFLITLGLFGALCLAFRIYTFY